MKTALRRSIVGFVFSIFVIGALLLVFGELEGAQADDNYDPTLNQRLCNGLPATFPEAALQGDSACTNALGAGRGATSAPREQTTRLNLAGTDLQFSNLTIFEPSEVTHTPGCNIDTIGSDGIEDDREYTTGAPANERTSGDGIDNDADGDIDGADADNECLRPGDMVGGLRNIVSLGTLNSPCNQLDKIIDFYLFNIALPDDASNPRNSTNIYTPKNEGEGDRIAKDTIDADTDERADAGSGGIMNYPDWLLDLFDPDWLPIVPPVNGPKDGTSGTPGSDDRQNSVDGDLKPLIPIAVYGGITEIAGTWVPLYFVQFEAGQLAAGFAAPHPYSQAVTSLGKPSMTILTDPTPILASTSTITDFCSALISDTMLLGTTVTDGQVRATNPDDAGSHAALAWTMSQRDLDNDGFEAQIDTCPTVANIDTDPRRTGIFDPADPDGDMIDGACDPDTTIQGCGVGYPDNQGGDDCDNDNPAASDRDFQNAQDNCPLIANIDQTESESLQAYGTAAPDGGPKADGIGDLCDGNEGGVILPSPPPTSCGDTVDNDSDTGDPGGGTDSADADCQATFTQNGVPGNVVDLSPTVANGKFHIIGRVMPTCYGAAKTDSDGDGWCADTAGEGDSSALLHPSLAAHAIGADHDGDGRNAFVETFMGSEDAMGCNHTTTKGDEPLDGWSTDFNDDQTTDIFDINILKPAFFKNATQPAYDNRADLNADSTVDIFDINVLKPNFFKSCIPTAQQ